MKLNELVCPSCGLKCLVDAAFTTCDSCNTYFFANQSRSVDNPAPAPVQQPIQITPQPIQITPWPPQPPFQYPYITWVGTVPPDYGTASTVIEGDARLDVQVWN